MRPTKLLLLSASTNTASDNERTGIWETGFSFDDEDHLLLEKRPFRLSQGSHAQRATNNEKLEDRHLGRGVGGWVSFTYANRLCYEAA